MIQVRDLDLSGPVAFLVVAGISLVDGVVPLLPTTAAVIGLGVIAGTGDARAYPLLAVATVAAFVSDNLAYWLGGRFSSRVSGVVVRGERSRRVWTWVERIMRSHGLLLVALARILPGGPTPITLTAGSVGLPQRRFRVATAVSVVLWSAYAFGIGMFGNALFGGNPVLALLAGVGLAAALNLVLRALLRRNEHPGEGEPGSDDAVNCRKPESPVPERRYQRR